MLEIIGAGLVGITLTLNLINYRNLIKTREKLKEEFEASHKVVKEDKMAQDILKMNSFLSIGASLLNAVFYAILAGLTGSIWFTLLAFLVVALGYHNSSKNLKALQSGKFSWGLTDRAIIPLETIALVAFIVMFWFI